MIYTREITDEEIKALEHYVLDVKQWVDDAIAGKIASCQKRIVRGEIDKAIAAGSEIVTSQNEILTSFFSNPEYKKRLVREQLEDEAFRAKFVPPVETSPVEPTENGEPA